MSRLVAFLRRIVRVGKTLATDKRIPKWVRGLLVFGCLPIPFFLDEACLVLAVSLLLVRHRDVVREAWTS